MCIIYIYIWICVYIHNHRYITEEATTLQFRFGRLRSKRPKSQMYDGWLGLPASGTQSFQSPNSPKLPTSWYTKWPAISSISLPLGQSLKDPTWHCSLLAKPRQTSSAPDWPSATKHHAFGGTGLGARPIFSTGNDMIFGPKIQKAGKHHETPCCICTTCWMVCVLFRAGLCEQKDAVATVLIQGFCLQNPQRVSELRRPHH